MLTFFYFYTYIYVYINSVCRRDMKKTDMNRFHASDHYRYYYYYYFVLSLSTTSIQFYFILFSLEEEISFSLLSLYSRTYFFTRHSQFTHIFSSSILIIIPFSHPIHWDVELCITYTILCKKKKKLRARNFSFSACMYVCVCVCLSFLFTFWWWSSASLHNNNERTRETHKDKTYIHTYILFFFFSLSQRIDALLPITHVHYVKFFEWSIYPNHESYH